MEARSISPSHFVVHFLMTMTRPNLNTSLDHAQACKRGCIQGELEARAKEDGWHDCMSVRYKRNLQAIGTFAVVSVPRYFKLLGFHLERIENTRRLREVSEHCEQPFWNFMHSLFQNASNFMRGTCFEVAHGCTHNDVSFTFSARQVRL